MALLALVNQPIWDPLRGDLRLEKIVAYLAAKDTRVTY
jgi:hypothetical protein